ncbi:ABC-type transport auxiliary lipoprotein family protein [Dongia sedimenti]|uniref:ABC-type transport auxiliary lipoprotein family protein n=1 Tax=Dongia sedimenti TaxID=3064282 RepID=A0ABU0YQC0_9PROT|nr:ABC-type transport auxiliary lipoprotein family protein [Rhodospirillaceae bacterium R-7]
MKRAFSFLPVVGFVLVAACMAPSVPKEQYFRLVATPATEKLAHPLVGILEASPLGADGVTGERPLLYTANGGTKLEQRNYAYWTELPTAMIRDQLVTYLRSAGAAEQVVPSELRIGAAYRIQGEIKRLEQSAGKKSDVGILELELSVIDENTDQLILSRVYHTEQPAADHSIDAAVAALNAGLQDVLKRFAADIDAR